MHRARIYFFHIFQWAFLDDMMMISAAEVCQFILHLFIQILSNSHCNFFQLVRGQSIVIYILDEYAIVLHVHLAFLQGGSSPFVP